MKTDSRKQKPEIMAPAGDWISLRAALDAGCDAVYFGIGSMNMRAGAKNFPLSALKRITKLCHDNNVKAYIALNTIVYENEITKIKKIISKAKENLIDAIICWDFAVIQEATQQGIPVHISTQMNVSSSESILFFYNHFRIRRFVLARECSLDDIKTIKKDLTKALGSKAKLIEIEVFAHGAMCVSISGRCFLSQFQYNKSANRGECLQPCRREYIVTEKEERYSFIIGNHFILSPKDLCTLPFIEKLIKVGIASFKIEGRNRSPEYVSVVTAAYRKAVDFYFLNNGRRGFQKEFESLKKELTHTLNKVYNRGFSAGFFLGKPINEWTDRDGNKAAAKKEYIGIVKKYYKKLGVAEVQVESKGFKLGDEILFQGPTTGVLTQIAESIEIDHHKIDQALKGTLVAVRTKRLVRVNDRVYVVVHQKKC
jgi:putative protease